MTAGPEDLAPGDEVPPGTPSAGADVCPDCAGNGRAGDAACATCGGTGQVETAVGGG